MAHKEPIRVLVADDSAVYRKHAQVFHPEDSGHLQRIQRIGRRLHGPRDYGYLIASRRIAGYPANEPSSPPTDG
jgi:hypothetical protein